MASADISSKDTSSMPCEASKPAAPKNIRKLNFVINASTFFTYNTHGTIASEKTANYPVHCSDLSISQFSKITKTGKDHQYNKSVGLQISFLQNQATTYGLCIMCVYMYPILCAKRPPLGNHPSP